MWSGFLVKIGHFNPVTLSRSYMRSSNTPSVRAVVGRVGQAVLSALGFVGWLSRVFGSFGGVVGCGGSFLSEVFYAEQDVGRDVEKDAKAQEIFKRGQGFARLVRLI